MDEQVETQRSLDPNTNPIMAPPHVVLDDDPTRLHPLSVDLDVNEDSNMDESENESI